MKVTEEQAAELLANATKTEPHVIVAPAAPKADKPKRGGFWKGAALVGGLWLAYNVGMAHSERLAHADSPKPVAATHAAPKAHKPATRHARPAGVRVTCGAYDLTFAPHDRASADDAAKAAASFIMNNTSCASK